MRISRLPPALRLLCVGPVEPSWVGLTLALDAEGCLEPSFQWVSTASEALALLRDECFDCLVLDGNLSQPAGESALFALLHAVRGGGCDDPMLILAAEASDALWAAAHAADGDVLVTRKCWDSSALVPSLIRALERSHLRRENQRFAVADRRRLVRERDEAETLLSQQRQILQALERQMAPALPADQRPGFGSIASPRTPPVALPADVENYYQELLRTYVIMGSGNLGAEIGKLVEFLAWTELSPRQALELHLARVEELVRGLGNRSTRHVMARADLLALELMIHLGEHYQRRSAGHLRDGGKTANGGNQQHGR